MPVFNKHKELRNVKKYGTLTTNRVTETNSSESNDFLNALRGNADSESEARILTQEKVDEQIRTYCALLIRQLEDLNRLIQRMSSVHQQNLSSKAGTSDSSTAAGPSLVSET